MKSNVNNRIIKRITAIFLILIILSIPFNSSAEAAVLSDLKIVRDEQSDRFFIIDKSDISRSSYPFDINDDVSLEIGNLAKSNLEISYVFNENVNSEPKEYVADSYTASVSVGDYRVENTENGFRVIYNFANEGFTIPVLFEVKENYFEATIELSNIKEGSTATITAIRILPYFAAGTSAETGSIFVPDGSGAIINYNNGVATEYEKAVYGDELAAPEDLEDDVSENIKFPVFGNFNGKTGMLGIITEGSALSSITAKSGSVSSGTYNIAAAKLNYRSVYSKSLMSGQNKASRTSFNAKDLNKYTVRYYFLSGENVGIMDLAKTYREYLMNDCGLKKLEFQTEFNLNLIGAIDVKANFLGIPYRKTKSLTTYAQAEKIIEYLNSMGIDGLSIKYSGWMADGVSNKKLPSAVKYSGKLGDAGDLKSLNELLTDQNGKLYPEVDLLNYRSGSSGKTIKNAFREVAWQSVYMPSVYASRLDVPKWKVVSSEYLSKNANKFFKSFAKTDIDNLVLSGVCDLPYSNLDSKSFVSRNQTQENFIGVLKNAQNRKLSISANSASDYALPYVTKIFSAPTNNSNEKIMDERVPFYSLVLHGIIPMTSEALTYSDDNKYSYLSAVENGYEIMFTGMYADSSAVKDTAYDKYFSTNYEHWADAAVEIYKEYYPILEKIYNSQITDYRKFNENINVITYENGIVLYVNYGDFDLTVDGVTVNAESFAFLEG